MPETAMRDELYARIRAIGADLDAIYSDITTTSVFRHPVKWWQLTNEHMRLCNLHSKYYEQLMELL